VHVIALGEMAAGAADDHSQFALVIHALGKGGGPANFASRAEQRRVGLEEDEGVGGDGVAQFLGVLDVVAADAYDLAGFDGRDQGRIVERQLLHAAAGQFIELALAQMRRREQQARNVVFPGHRLNQAVADLSFVREAAVFHGVRSKVSQVSKFSGCFGCYQLRQNSLSSRLAGQMPSTNYK
jgi:hypothetical protein